MKSVALVTWKGYPKLFDGDKLLIEPFRKRGFVPIAIPWDKKDIDWTDFDIVILRSCWDYHTRLKEFYSWIDQCIEKKVNLWNPPEIIRWNTDKSYLFNLQKIGIPIMPTLLCTKDSIDETRNNAILAGWKNIIIKPIHGASSYKTFRINTAEFTTSNPTLSNLFSNENILIQPFMEEIITEGEYSFIFINKEYSHAILKVPQKNEFRSQREFGGKEIAVNPSQSLISQSQKVLENIYSPLLYARVDGLNIRGQFQLMELELTEPYLFFEKKGNSEEKFVNSAINLSGNSTL
ncbi:hypothetical protein M1271_03500 [Patescibacteria group bacterium]|nr:hypothetical protein [Patescibacteria group bacterium]MCL5797841.1 hypothetical protein [Patescibacteria group bacterium]